MIPFLRALAMGYANRYRDFSDLCFVFPNKRSATFFTNYLCETSQGKAFIAPETTTLTEFAIELSGSVADSRIDLLFILYKEYVKLLKKEATEEPLSFDEFRNWGDVVLQDFETVDAYGVNPAELFRNVRDFKEIQTNFLTEEQERMMEEYFGAPDRYQAYNSFWNSLHYQAPNAGHQTEIKRKFLYLWKVLAPLYEALDKELQKRGLTYPGRALRQAYEKIVETEGACLPYKKVVFVGLGMLSTMELAILKELKTLETDDGSEPYADFCWDFTGPAMTDERNTSVAFMRSHLKNFPSPDWLAPYLEMAAAEQLPEKLELIAAPSNAAQAKIAGSILEKIQQEVGEQPFSRARVGVVLPDENLLLPLLYSIPPGIPNVNLSMGYPLRLTSTVSFVGLLRRLQMRKRRHPDGSWYYFHQDIHLLLGHPFVHALIGTPQVSRLRAYIRDNHKFTLSYEETVEQAPALAALVEPIDNEAKASRAIDYVDSALQSIATVISGKEELDGLLKRKLDLSHIEAYRDALRRLADAISEHKIDVTARTAFSMADRLIAAEKVPFEGEPVKGMQIVGLLETRCVDFKYLIVPSLNERVFPRRIRSRSFIPANLRLAYRMPLTEDMERTYAYYFYRMIARAKGVYFLYDARTEGLKSGDMSRYLLQLRHLYAHEKLHTSAAYYRVAADVKTDISIPKADIAQRLLAFQNRNTLSNISASSLQNYLTCPLKFYYSSLIGIKDDPEPSQYMDAIAQGNIIHKTMMYVYLEKGERGVFLPTPQLITRERIDKILADEVALRRLVNNVVHEEYTRQAPDTPLTGEAAITANMLYKQVRSILKKDRALAPIRLYGCEVRKTFSWPTAKGRNVNMTCAIDRIDAIQKDGEWQMRIIDYKTGSVHLQAETGVEEVFSGDYHSKHIFQLMLYAEFYNHLFARNNPVPLRLEIYDVQGIGKSIDTVALPLIFKKPMHTHLDQIEGHNVHQEFNQLLEAILEEIFDDETPFCSTDDTSRCGMCAYRTLCSR